MNSSQLREACGALAEAQDPDGGGHASREDALVAVLPHFEATLDEVKRLQDGFRELYRLNLGRHCNDLHADFYAAYSDVSDASAIIEELTEAADV